MSVTVVTSGANLDVQVSLPGGGGGSYDINDLISFLGLIPGVKRFSAYANRGNEAEAITPIIGSGDNINNGCSFDASGFTGDGSAAYIDSTWNPDSQGTWDTQMWCGWMKVIGDGTSIQSIVGFGEFVNPNYATFELRGEWVAGPNRWELDAFGNDFLSSTLETTTNNGTDSSAYPNVDVFYVYQWTPTQVELWVNGRLLLTRAVGTLQSAPGTIYELASNLFGSPRYPNPGTISLSGYGTYLSADDIADLYLNVKAYIYRQAKEV